MGEVLRAEGGRGTIHQIPNINRAFVAGNAAEGLTLKTEGINILVRHSSPQLMVSILITGLRIPIVVKYFQSLSIFCKNA
jgi:hypothetical protein